VADWYFIPITMQYLIGSGLTILISMFLISRNPKSWVYRSFFFYGFFVALWCLMAFFHRNAPTMELSKEFLDFGATFGFIFPAFLLITFLNLKKSSKFNSFALVPAIVLGLVAILLRPFEIFWTDFGWSYNYTNSYFFAATTLVNVGYIISNLIVGVNLIRTAQTAVLRRKYNLLLLSYVLFYVVFLSISNMLLISNVDYPPLGGIISILAFLAIARAITLQYKPSSENVQGYKKEGDHVDSKTKLTAV